LTSIVPGSFFFQPLQLNLEPPDLLVEVRLKRLLLALLAATPSVAGEKPCTSFQQLTLPCADLVGMHFIFTGELTRRLLTLGGFQRNLEFELLESVSVILRPRILRGGIGKQGSLIVSS